ncbi:MAG: hypothetical protein OXE79_07425 [Acidimicrobiaceae bacterium]|nr:hypothetical protein [Acidimicrobiaceae bacterium]MCY4293307.1 hypothetical protein [Acidimicrobiaceae bacterium]
MMLAASATAINIVELLHILTVVAALGPVFVHPLLRRQMAAAGSSGYQRLVLSMASNARRVHGPALIVAGLLGIALVEMSEGATDVSDGWVIAAIVIWVTMVGLLHGLVRPALKAQGGEGSSEGSAGEAAAAAASKRLETGAALISILFVVQVVLMIWQPG